MKEYCDSEYMVIDGTLIMYFGPGGDIVVPESVGGMTVKRIGSRAYTGDHIRSIYVPDSVETVHPSAFDCSSLHSLSVPAKSWDYGMHSSLFLGLVPRSIEMRQTPVSPQMYQTIKSCSIPGFFQDGHPCQILEQVPQDLLPVQPMWLSIYPTRFPHHAGYLGIHPSRSPASKDIFDSGTDILSIGEESPGILSEKAVFSALCRPEQLSWRSAIAEEANDRFVRQDKFLSDRSCVSLFTYDDSKTCRSEDVFHVTFTFHAGYIFYPAVHSIVYSKRQYHLYQRYYLCSANKFEFVRENVALFRNGQLVTNQKEAQTVYEKYHLMSIL